MYSRKFLIFWCKYTFHMKKKRFFNSNNSNLIWVYNIENLCLLNDNPFNTKSECATYLKISRTTVTKYLDSNKLLKDKFVFKSFPLNSENLLKLQASKKIPWEVITGELLGDGHIRYDPLNNPQVNGRLEFTFSAKIIHYINHLKFGVLSSICTDSSPTPWPKEQATQYWFSSKRMLVFSELHSYWYENVDGIFVKILPKNIEELLTPISLAHWIMGDGYYSNGNVVLCTDNFSKKEVLLLIDILTNKFSIRTGIKRRVNKSNVVYRINISKTSLSRLKKLVLPYIIPEMQYKLGITDIH